MINTLNFSFGHPKWGKLEGQYELLNNYAYFKNILPDNGQDSDSSRDDIKKEEELVVSPEQYEGTIGYLKLRFSQQLDFGSLPCPTQPSTNKCHTMKILILNPSMFRSGI